MATIEKNVAPHAGAWIETKLYSNREQSKIYNVCHETINRIVNNTMWTNREG